MARSGKKGKGFVREEPSAFGNVKNQLAYCGLWCGSCLVGNGTVNDRARSCSKAITDYGVHEWGPKDVDYGSLLKGLATIGSMKPCVGCIKGGGRTNCEIRACATARGHTECVECSEHGSCQNTKLIDHMRTGAAAVGMKVKKERGPRAKLMKEWSAEIVGP